MVNEKKSLCVKICGIEYAIVFCDQIENVSEDANEQVLGNIRFSDGLIQIRNEMSKDVTRQTLVHEILHGVFQHLGIEQQETQIDTLATAIYVLIRDNPLVIEYLSSSQRAVSTSVDTA